MIKRRGVSTFQMDHDPAEIRIRESPHRGSLTQTRLKGALRRRLGSVVPDYEVTNWRLAEEHRTMKFLQIITFVKEEDYLELWNILKSGITSEDIVDFSSNTTVLHIAAKDAHSKEVWDVLLSEPEICSYLDEQDERGISPLIAASWYNNIEAVKCLVNHNADLHLYVKNTRKTALHCAAELPQNDITKILLEQTKNKFFIDAQDSDGNTALMLAVNADSPSIGTFLSEGADYTRRSSFTGRNIFHMAIVNNNIKLVSYLCENCTAPEFLDALDMNGDSPFMLAIRLGCDSAIDVMFQAKNVEAILFRSLQSLHILVDKKKISVIRKLLSIVEEKSVFNCVDKKGRTVLIHAIESDLTVLVDMLIRAGVSYKTRNYKTGETVLHAAANSNSNAIIERLFSLREIEEVIHVKDYKGLTAYELFLANGRRDIWRKIMESGLIDQDYRNDEGESALFIAAKEGNIFLVMNILLSERFHSHFDAYTLLLEKNELISLELKGIIYASDIYILCGHEVGSSKSAGRGWRLSPDQHNLFAHNKHGYNIFHALTLGDSLECLSLVYNYCLRYNTFYKDLDTPDYFGNTPLMFAIGCNSKSIAHFFISNGAQLISKNNLHQMPLDKFNNQLSTWKSTLISIVEGCVIMESDSKEKKISSRQYEDLTIHFELFCPPGINQMRVLSNMFNKLTGDDAVEILESPVIESFVMLKWEKLRYMVSVRFLLYSVYLIVLSTYLWFILCPFLGLEKDIFVIFEWILLLIASLTWLWLIPFLFGAKKSQFITMSVSPLLTLYFITTDYISRNELEVAGAAVLFGWLSLIYFGFLTKMSFQIAIYTQVLKAVFSHLPMFLILCLGFAKCFFTLYHDFFEYNNPLHAFMTTTIYLITGPDMLPQFNHEMETLQSKSHLYQSYDKETHILDGEKEIRGYLIEGFIYMLFDIIVTISVMNMLIGLAVSHGEKLAEQGKLQRTKSIILAINYWELISETKFFKFIARYKLTLFFGILPSLKHRLALPTTFKPSYLSTDVNVQEMAHIAHRSAHAEKIPFLDYRKLYLKENVGIGSEKSRKYSSIMNKVAWIYRRGSVR